jgi:ABC-type antimicrobial peptide transport system permease subunit
VRITENAVMAVKNLRTNKMRSFLTMLGIIIGVGAVIAMVSLGEGAKNQITQHISAMGSNLIIVSPGRNSADSINNKTVSLVEGSSEFIQMIAPAARDIKLAEAGGQSLRTSIVGCTPEYAIVRNYQVEFGNFLTAADCSARRRIAVIGAQPEEILTLFLMEAVTLSLIGGAIGIAWGGGIALLIGKAIGWSITISGPAVVVAFIFSMAVGLFFGVYPAYKASGLNPIEALRHE